jgi:hypothetical protein
LTHRPLAARAALSLFFCLAAHPAFAHAVCGARVFPATLGIDDPGVGDEIALPTVTYLPTNSGGQNEADVTFNYTKTIFPGFGVSVQEGATFLNPQGWGRDDVSTEEKYNFLCIPQVEFMSSVGFAQDWGKTYTNAMGADFDTFSPVLDAGVGFGGLPRSLNFLRPLAVTAEVSEDIPDRLWTDGAPNSYNLNWGFTVQYSLPYFNANVAQIDNALLKHIVAVTEFTFSRPVYNFAPGGNVTTGTIQPGLLYMANTWQFSAEAILPINSASGRGVGVIAEYHLFLDDLLPNSLGKPLFGANR